MSAPLESEDRPVSMRLSEAEIALIDRAASLRGRSRAEFVRAAAVHLAEDVLAPGRTVRMSDESFADFLAAMSGPPTPVPEMVELLERCAPWEGGGAMNAKR